MAWRSPRQICAMASPSAPIGLWILRAANHPTAATAQMAEPPPVSSPRQRARPGLPRPPPNRACPGQPGQPGARPAAASRPRRPPRLPPEPRRQTAAAAWSTSLAKGPRTAHVVDRFFLAATASSLTLRTPARRPDLRTQAGRDRSRRAQAVLAAFTAGLDAAVADDRGEIEQRHDVGVEQDEAFDQAVLVALQIGRGTNGADRHVDDVGDRIDQQAGDLVLDVDDDDDMGRRRLGGGRARSRCAGRRPPGSRRAG